VVQEMPFGNGRGLVRGDKFPYRYRFDTAGLTASEAWLTVKETPASQADGSALFQKVITSTNVAGTGQIEDTGSSSGTCVVRFDITTTNSEAAVAGTKYTYDVQALFSNGDIYTLLKGPAIWTDQVTRDS
jgi:hypothetical protein